MRINVYSQELDLDTEPELVTKVAENGSEYHAVGCHWSWLWGWQYR